jgi:hypothetical protein
MEETKTGQEVSAPTPTEKPRRRKKKRDQDPLQSIERNAKGGIYVNPTVNPGTRLTHNNNSGTQASL